MRNTNKKGFTIVELVIVIAVIAILAAVLIPTFSSIIKKANIASDTAVAKNLNTAAISAGADTFDQAIAAVKDAGYLLANLNAKADGCYFVWDDVNNQFLLVDTKNDYKVIYSNTDASEKSDTNWLVAVSDPEAIAAITAAGCGFKKIATSFENLQENIAAGGTIYVDESVVLNADNRIVVENNTDENVTFEFAGSSVNTKGNISGIPVEIIKGKVTINGAVVGGSGSFENTNGTFSTAIGYEGFAHLVLNNSTITGQGNAVSGASHDDGPAYVELNNCNLYSDNVGFQMSTPGTALLKDTNVNCPNPIFASYGANITIDGGKYVSTSDCLFEMNDNTTADRPTTVTVKDGEFTFNTFAIFNNTANMKIVIEGGTFNGEDYLTFFADYEGATVTINGNVVTITK